VGFLKRIFFLNLRKIALRDFGYFSCVFAFAQLFSHAWRVGDLTLFKALTGGAFDLLNWQHSGEFDKKFSKKSNAPGFARGWGHGRFWN